MDYSYSYQDLPPSYNEINKDSDDIFIEIYTLFFFTITICLSLTDIDKLLCLYIYILLQTLFYILFKFAYKL